MTGRLYGTDRLFGFPNPVNELAARAVAAGVLSLALLSLLLSSTLGLGWLWLTVPQAYGFLARVLTGPTLSPLGQLATRLVAPRLGRPRPVPGPPKRFAQALGATISLAAVVAHFGFEADWVAGEDRTADAEGEHRFECGRNHDQREQA